MSALQTKVLRRLKSIVAPQNNYVHLPEDEYVSWLRIAVAGMLDYGNLYCFDYAIKNLPGDSPIIEIGSFSGLSTNLLTHFKRKHHKQNRLFTSDRWEFERDETNPFLGDSSITHETYRAFIRENYIRNVRMFSADDLPYTVEMFSDDFFAAWRAGEQHSDVFGRPVQMGGPISFCYIDGNHTYAFARRDFENADEFLEPGGFILFDDSQDDSEWEVRRVVAEVAAGGNYELVLKNPNYLFRKK